MSISRRDAFAAPEACSSPRRRERLRRRSASSDAATGRRRTSPHTVRCRKPKWRRSPTFSRTKWLRSVRGCPSRRPLTWTTGELIRDPKVGIVVIATPGYLHKQMALEALRAGKDLLLEKPIALNYADALEIVREAKRSRRIVAVGMQRRYAQQDTAVRQAIEGGMIGPSG